MCQNSKRQDGCNCSMLGFLSVNGTLTVREDRVGKGRGSNGAMFRGMGGGGRARSLSSSAHTDVLRSGDRVSPSKTRPRRELGALVEQHDWHSDSESAVSESGKLTFFKLLLLWH
eukprot:1930638-Rhodomonas_salina.2